MRTEEPPEIVGHAIFCDDIRLEIDQKASYIGVYSGGTMYVRAEFPITLPKFAIAVSFAQKREIFVPNIGLRIFLPGDTDEKPSIEAETVPGMVLPDNEKNLPMILMGAQLVFTPLTLNQPGLIKVRAVRNGLLHRLGTLQIIKAPSPSPGPTTASAFSPPS